MTACTRRDSNPFFSCRLAALTLGCAALWLATAGTAHAVDGVIEINQVKAMAGEVTPGDAPGFPVTLSEPGSYRLTSNLEVPTPDTRAIDIVHSKVTVDLNGFTVGACLTDGVGCISAGNERGIYAGSTREGVVVRNGNVRGFSGHGISLGRGGRVEHVRVESVGGKGVFVWDDAIVRHVVVQHAGSDGIHIQGRATVTDSRVRGSGNHGISLTAYENLTGGLVRGNSVEDAGGDGINAAAAVVRDNAVLNSSVVGIRCLGGCVVEANTSHFNSTGYSLSNGTVVGNVAAGNTNAGFYCATTTAVGHNIAQGNNGGVGNPQMDGCTEIDTNICDGDIVCP